MPIMNAPPLLSVKEVTKYYPLPGGILGRDHLVVQAVDKVSFCIHSGETFGLVGESGCGKSTLCRVIARLENANGGQIIFDGHNLREISPHEMRSIRQNIQMIFQDAKASLHPLHRVRDALAEPFLVHGILHSNEIKPRIEDLLRRVGLQPEHGDRLPKQLSGGQRQLVCIARAIALQPKLIICDEPVSSLDVSTQSQVLNLLQDLQEELGLAFLFVSHNLNVVDYLCDTIAVMYLGKLVEIALKTELVQNPRHPYTKALIASVPSIQPKSGRTEFALTSEIPSAASPPSGCRFHTRCPFVFDRCRIEEPVLQEKDDKHLVSCHLF